MTNKQAATKLLNILNDDIYSWSPEILEAFRMAVDALKGAEGDCISRAAAINRIESHLRVGDELYPLTDTDKVLNRGLEIAASCVYNLPSAQSTHGNTSNALKSLDCIDRQDAIEDAREAFKRNPTMAIRVMDLIKSMPSAQTVAKDIIVPSNDCISRQAAVDALNGIINRFDQILRDIRESKVDDSVCGMCEYDGAFVGQSGDWCNECPGFEKEDCFRLSDECRKRWLESVELPSAQTEQCKDAVSKAKVLEAYADLYDVFDDNKGIQNELHKVFDRINNLPPAQTEHNSDDERKIADLHKMVNYLLSRLEQPWIPVSEGLPKEYGEYICTMENGQVQECGFVPENQRGLVDGWSTCEADGHKFLGYADVLAWMPLPEPYKEEGEADD